MSSDLLNNREKDELLELLESNDIVEQHEGDNLTHTDEVLPFIYRYNLKPGINQVNFDILYKLYGHGASEVITKTQLTKRLGLFFKIKFIGRKRMIYLDASALNIAEELYKERNKSKIDVRKSNAKRKAFEKFIKEMRIENGKEFVPGLIFYELYSIYHRKNKKTKGLSYINFIKMVSIFFEYKKVAGGVKWFGLREGLINEYLTGEDIERLKEKRKRSIKRKRTKKRKESKSKEVSSVRSEEESEITV